MAAPERWGGTAIENLWRGIEQGQSVEMLTDRLHKRQAEKQELEAQLAIEKNKRICLTEGQVMAFLDYVCDMANDDVNKRRAIINIFVHSVYLYDDNFTLIINASEKPLSVENIPLDDIDAAFQGEQDSFAQSSSMKTSAPPNSKQTNSLFVCFVMPYQNKKDTSATRPSFRLRFSV